MSPNPHESRAARDARHREEAAYRQEQVVKNTQEKYKTEVQSLKEQLEALKRETPDPESWQLIDAQEFGPFIVIKLKYNVNLHNGVKILVYKASLIDLMKQKHLDPHFAGEGTIGTKVAIYPIARFEPSSYGWADALMFAKEKQTRCDVRPTVPIPNARLGP